MKDFEKFIRQYLSSFLAVVAVLVSLSSIISLVKIDKNLIFSAGLTLAGAAVAVFYSYFLIRFRQRIFKRKRPLVFISYSHQDSEFVNKLKHDLEAMGLILLIDRPELHVGDNINQAINRVIDQCDYVIFVSSEHTKHSSWSKNEIEQAVKLGKRILPLVLSPGTLPEVLRGVYYADFSKDYAQGISALKRTFFSQNAAKNKAPEENA